MTNSLIIIIQIATICVTVLLTKALKYKTYKFSPFVFVSGKRTYYINSPSDISTLKSHFSGDSVLNAKLRTINGNSWGGIPVFGFFNHDASFAGISLRNYLTSIDMLELFNKS